QMIDEIAQARAGGRALRKGAVVGADARQQRGGIDVPADLAEVRVDPRRGSAGEEILQVQLNHHVLADVRQRVADDGMPALKAGGALVRAEPAQQAVEDPTLHCLERLARSGDGARPASTLLELKLVVF